MAENTARPSATVAGDLVTVHNIGNFSECSDTAFTPACCGTRFDLRQPKGIDLVSVCWMGPQIAHVFLSFAFTGGEHSAISIEARQDKGEGRCSVNDFVLVQIYRLDGLVATDLPVSAARAIGANIVIVVNVGRPLLKRRPLNASVGVAGPMLAQTS